MEKRLGHRVALEPEEVGWRVAPATRGPARRRFAPFSRKPQVAHLLDLSVSGLLVEAPEARDLGVGSIVHVRIDEVTGPVRVRRIEPVGPGRCHYGLELCQEARELTTHLHARLSRDATTRPGDWHGERWSARGGGR